MAPFDKPKSFAEQFIFSVDEIVNVAWTCCSHQYKAKAKVIKVNKESYTVTLLESLDGYPIGNKIRVPKLGSISNRLFKLGA